MYFTSLILKNIQKHKDLKIILSPGLNLITGDSGKGKSGVLRSIQWLYGEPVRSIMRDGEKKCSIEATLDNGIIIKRSKSATVNRYEVFYPGKDEPEIYDKVGKEIPETIAKLLGKVTLNVDGEELLLDFTKQREPYFFLGEKASFRMKILNKLTGSEVIDRTVHAYNKKLHQISKEQTIFETEIKSKQEELVNTSGAFEEKKIKLDGVKVLIDKIQVLEKKNSILKTALDRLNTTNTKIKELQKVKITTIPQVNIDKLKILSQKNVILRDLVHKYTKINAEIKENQSKLLQLNVIDLSNLKTLDEKITKLRLLVVKNKELTQNIIELSKRMGIIKSAEVDIESLKQAFNRLESLRDSVARLKSNRKTLNDLDNQKKCLTSQIQQNSAKIDALIQDAKGKGLCPNCKINLHNYGFKNV